MPVYVDNEKNNFGRLIMCHMIADSLEELHKMADNLGLKRKWFQASRTPHYDICQSKKKQAIKMGAILLDTRRKAYEVMKRIRNES